MSDGIMWYAVGICMGIAIGSSSLKEEVENRFTPEMDAAADAGAVSETLNCEALVFLQGTLNEVYEREARGDAVANQYDFSVEDCEAIVKAKPPSPN